MRPFRRIFTPPRVETATQPPMPEPIQIPPAADPAKAGLGVRPSPGAGGSGEELRLARVLVNGFLANIPYSVYFKDRQGRFIANSQSQASQFGVKDVNEVKGKTDFDFFAEAHARPSFDDEQEIIKTGKPIIGKLEKETWPDGRVTWALTTKLPLRDANG